MRAPPALKASLCRFDLKVLVSKLLLQFIDLYRETGTAAANKSWPGIGLCDFERLLGTLSQEHALHSAQALVTSSCFRPGGHTLSVAVEAFSSITSQGIAKGF